MSSPVAKELEIILSNDEAHDEFEKIESHERLSAIAVKDDLPELLAALKSDRNDFFTRELLAQPISELGGAECLVELFEAFQKNFDEGHDNDGFSNSLIEIASIEPEKCRIELMKLLAVPDFKHKEHAQWLLEFCN